MAGSRMSTAAILLLVALAGGLIGAVTAIGLLLVLLD
jgi:hypothetical protein